MGRHLEESMKKTIILSAAVLALGASAVLAQQGTTNSTNGYTAADRTRAEGALRAAGYTPGVVASAQAGSIFIHGEKGGQKFLLTVTADNKVYASAGSTSAMPTMAWAPGTGGGGGGRGGD